MHLAPVTTADVKSMVQTVVEAHATHNTFYSVWNTVKDRESELTYPCVLWGPWRSRIAETEIGLERTVTVALVVITAMPTDRTPEQRDTAVHQAEQAAAQFTLKLREDYPDYRWENVQCSPQFDEYTALETGVVLSFTVSGVVECLDDDAFEPGGGDCPSLAELIEGSTWVTIKAAMSPEQLAAAEADICDIPEPTTVNGTESDTPTITVVQGGVEVGTLNPATGVHTVPECDDCVAAEWVLKDEAGNELDSGVIASGGVADIVAPDAKVQLKDSAANNIGSENSYLSGSSNNLTAPDASWTLKDQDDEVISTGTILSGGSSDIVAPPATYTVENTAGDLLAFDTIQSGQSGLYVAPNGTVTILNPNGDSLGTQAVRSNGTANFTAPIPLKFVWAPGDADTYTWTVTADEAGTYTTYTQTGTNGTLTYSLNGGGYVALSGTIVLTVGDTITVRRTTTTNAGTVRWAP